MTKIKKRSKKSLIVIAVLVLVIAALALFAYQRSSNSSEQARPADGSETLNLDPPTNEEIQAAADNKKQIDEKAEQLKNQPTQQPGTKKAVKPSLTGAGQYNNEVELTGFVPGIFEDGGTCTGTFTHAGSASIVRTVTAVKEGSAVYCPLILVPVSEFPAKGQWSAILSYDSANASGASDAKQFEIK